MNEIWKWVPGFEDVLEVSNLGNVRRYYKQKKTRNGYKFINAEKDGKWTVRHVHRMVLEAFIGPCPDGMEACHFDGDKNNNSISNLKWDTRISNNHDQLLHGVRRVGEKHGMSKLTDAKVLEARNLVKRKVMTMSDLARRYGVCRKTIRDAVSGHTWRHLN